MHAAMAIDTVFDEIAASAFSLTTGMARLVRPAYHSPSPDLIREIEARIAAVRKQTIVLANKNKELKPKVGKLCTGVAFTPSEAAQRITDIQYGELMLRGVSGHLSNYRNRSIAEDGQLGGYRVRMINAYDEWIYQISVSVELLVEASNYLQQFTPTPDTGLHAELSAAALDGFVRASEAILQDAAAGKAVEFV